MSDDVRSFFQNVLLISRLPWVIVVNDIGHSIFISPVRHDANMSFKDHNITALPLLRFGNIGGQFDRITGEKHLQVSHPAKVYIFIRRCNSLQLSLCQQLWHCGLPEKECSLSSMD